MLRAARIDSGEDIAEKRGGSEVVLAVVGQGRPGGPRGRGPAPGAGPGGAQHAPERPLPVGRPQDIGDGLGRPAVLFGVLVGRVGADPPGGGGEEDGGQPGELLEEAPAGALQPGGRRVLQGGRDDGPCLGAEVVDEGRDEGAGRGLPGRVPPPGRGVEGEPPRARGEVRPVLGPRGGAPGAAQPGRDLGEQP